MNCRPRTDGSRMRSARACSWSLLMGSMLMTQLLPPAFPGGAQAESAAKHRRQGSAYLDQHDISRALEEFRAAVEVDPQDAASHDYLGVALAESGKIEQAAAEFERAVRLSTNSPQAHFHLALAYDKLARTLDAIRQYEAALRLRPDFLDARYALSADCWKLGDREGAIRLLQQIVQANPPFAAEVHYNLGIELRQVGRLEEATEELKAALRLDPRSVQSHLALAQSYTERQDFNSAIDSARRAVQLASKNPECHYDLGEALRLKGDLRGAASEFAVALAIEPRYPHA